MLAVIGLDVTGFDVIGLADVGGVMDAVGVRSCERGGKTGGTAALLLAARRWCRSWILRRVASEIPSGRSGRMGPAVCDVVVEGGTSLLGRGRGCKRRRMRSVWSQRNKVGKLTAPPSVGLVG